MLTHGFFQVIIVGEVNSGKSAVVRRYVHNFFSDRGEYRATLGVDFNLKLIHYNNELGPIYKTDFAITQQP